jgi:hypothetical protein
MIKAHPLKSLHVFFLLCFLTYGTVQLVKIEQLSLTSFILNHLNDLMIVPIVLTAALNVVWLIKKDRSIRLGPISIFSIICLYSVYFEWYLPRHMARYTADWYDVLCYTAGGGILYILQKLP